MCWHSYSFVFCVISLFQTMMFLNIIIKQYFIRCFGQSCLPFTVQIIPYLWFNLQFLNSSITQLYSILCDPMDWSTPGFPIHHKLTELLKSCLLSRRCHPTTLSSVIPFSSCLQFASIRVVTLMVAKVLELQLQHQSFQWIFRIHFLYDWLVLTPCSPKDSQEPSPKPQFKNINCSVLSFLYCPTLTSVRDYWKNLSFD